MSQIKQLQPKEGVTLLAVKVPEGAHSFKTDHSFHFSTRLIYWVNERAIGESMFIDGTLKLLGIATEIPEEVWQGIVESKLADERTGGLVYLNYNLKSKPDMWFSTATESAMSLLASHEVYSVNPYPFPGCNCSWNEKKEVTDKCDADNARYYQAEANTGTWVILVKHND